MSCKILSMPGSFFAKYVTRISHADGKNAKHSDSETLVVMKDHHCICA